MYRLRSLMFAIRENRRSFFLSFTLMYTIFLFFIFSSSSSIPLSLSLFMGQTNRKCGIVYFQNVDKMLYAAVTFAISLWIDNVPG